MTYKVKRVKILKIWQNAPNTKTFRVEHSADTNPGQFFQLSLPGYGECPISIASYNEKYIDFCIRKVGNLTKAIHKLSEGDYLFLRGPYGIGYPMVDLMGKDLIIVGGGTGVAPLRGVIEYIERFRNDFGEIFIFLGFRDENRILFNECTEKWCNIFHTFITLDKGSKKWKKAVGPVTTLLEKTKFNKERSIILTCGPPIMEKFVVQTFKNKKFDERQIFVSLERTMNCGLGKCGHCRIGKKYVCKDGPVFNYAVAKEMFDE